MIDWLRSRRVQEDRMSWFLGSLMIFGLWLILRPKQLTTNEIVKKYAARQQARIDRDEAREKQFKANVEAHKKRATNERTEASDRVERRLSAYLFFDVKQTSRLVDGVQARFTDKTREWCAEKAISDLERDRQI